jgi:hypothetical protein
MGKRPVIARRLQAGGIERKVERLTGRKVNASTIAGILSGLRAAGGGTGRIAIIAGLPAIASHGIPVLVPADVSNREIDALAAAYAADLASVEGRAA